MRLNRIKLEKKNIHSNPLYKAELVQGGGKKQVPCLRIEQADGPQWMYESNDIIRYLKNLQK